MKTIPLSKGKFALVDDEDWEWLSQWKWHASESKRIRLPSMWYARRQEGHAGPVVYMHREICIRSGKSPSSLFDHRDRNGLNNRRANLRECSKSQNGANQRKRPRTRSIFKGAHWYKRLGMWHAVLTCDGVHHSLGYFNNDEEAARAYDAAAKIYFGEFAKLNFP